MVYQSANIRDFFRDSISPNAKTVGMLYSHGRLAENDLPHWRDPTLRYFHLRSHLRFSEAVVREACSLAAFEFVGRPFLSVHWRRGDRVYYRDPNLSVGPEVVVREAIRHCRSLRLTDVYLMTNCGTPEDLSTVLGGLAAAGLRARRAPPDDGSWRNELHRLFLEAALASLARFFLASSSSVSGHILEERVLLGAARDSWANLTPDHGHEASRNLESQLSAVHREIEMNPRLRAAAAAVSGAGERAAARLAVDSGEGGVNACSAEVRAARLGWMEAMAAAGTPS
jgi:hypothetical protein